LSLNNSLPPTSTGEAEIGVNQDISNVFNVGLNGILSTYGKTTSSIFRDNVTDHMLPISISQQNFRKETDAEVFL
jgi:hypothetical protein